MRCLLASLIVAAVTTVRASVANIDAPHVPLPQSNTTSQWQYWLFDLVSPSGYSLVVNFVAGQEFGGEAGAQAYRAEAVTVFPNGTISNVVAESPSNGIISGTPNGLSNGIFPEVGGWNATSNGYNLNFVFEGVTGNMSLESIAPGHYPCDNPNDPSFNTTVAPNLVGPWLGWTSSVPGGNGTANLIINGEQIQFSGSAYHHVIFSLAQLSEVAAHWYWARGTAGSYTFAYFAYLPKNTTITSTDPNDWYTSGYLAKDGKQLANFCSAEQDSASYAQQHVEIETAGNVWTANPVDVGFYDLQTNGSVSTSVTYVVNGARYVFNQSAISVVMPGGSTAPYTQFSSKVQGGPDGEQTAEGLGYFDILNYGP